MRTEEYSKDDKGLLPQADFEFKQRRYDTAAPLYEQVLAALRQDGASKPADLAYCLEHLGDSLVQLGDYKKAFVTFGELHQIRQAVPGVNNADLLSAKFRLAKMLEMQGRLDDAIVAYEEGVALAEQSLYAGHPLLNVFYEALLNVLRESKADPAQVDQLLRKLNTVTAGNVVAGNLLESMNLKDYKSLSYKAPAEPADAAPKQPIKLPIAAIRNFTIGIIALALVGGGIYYGVTHMEKKKEEQKQQAEVSQYDGKVFESADGQDKLTFLFGGKVDSVIDGVKRELPVTVLPPGSEFSSGGMLADSRSFRETAAGMLADDGRLLYGDSSPDVKVIARMKAVAEAAQKYFAEHKEYPQNAKELTDIDPKLLDNPVSNAPDEIVVINAGKERDWTPEEAPPIVATLQKGALLPDEPEPAPGAVRCYYYLTGDKWVEGVKCLGFFIRVADVNGKFLPGHQLAKAFVAALINGKEPHIAGLYNPVAPPADDQIKAVKIISSETSAPEHY